MRSCRGACTRELCTTTEVLGERALVGDPKVVRSLDLEIEDGNRLVEDDRFQPTPLGPGPRRRASTLRELGARIQRQRFHVAAGEEETVFGGTAEQDPPWPSARRRGGRC